MSEQVLYAALMLVVVGRERLAQSFCVVGAPGTRALGGRTVRGKAGPLRQLFRGPTRSHSTVKWFDREVGSLENVHVARSRIRNEVDPGELKGTNLRVLKYPHPALRAENEEIEEFTDELKTLTKEMFKVMYAMDGVGLAAPQVGVNKRLMVFNPSDDMDWRDETVLVNPRIIARAQGTTTGVEGCLSFPGMTGMVKRENWIKVRAYNSRGKRVTKKYTDWTARIFLHEYDHLDRRVFIDHLSEDERQKVQAVLDKLVGDFGEGAAL